MTGVSFTPIYPKKMNRRVYEQSLTKALQAEARLHRSKLQKTISGWTNPPQIRTDYVVQGGARVSVTAYTRPVGTEEQVENWERLNLGVRPHKIVARRAPTLRFQTGYKARTKPRKFVSGRSRRSGPYVTPKVVSHPGIQAREWTKTLHEQRARPYLTRMRNAMRFAAIRTFL